MRRWRTGRDDEVLPFAPDIDEGASDEADMTPSAVAKTTWCAADGCLLEEAPSVSSSGDESVEAAVAVQLAALLRDESPAPLPGAADELSRTNPGKLAELSRLVGSELGTMASMSSNVANAGHVQ